ncbi:MAG: hypothetical protein Q4B54_00460 [Coriobacteriales bacterium]|nr:hypothetical protein [Coriobacteriales bacterium]
MIVQNNSNRVILAIAGILIVVVCALLFTAGGSFGGGGSGARSSVSPSLSSPASTAPNASTTATSEGENWDRGPTTADELKAELSRLDETVTGSNPRSAETSTAVPSAAQAYESLSQRGFGTIELQADYDIDGSYQDLHGVDASSGDRYPSYLASYVSSNNVLWLIYVNEGKWYARPLLDQSGAFSVAAILTEDDHLVQYDGGANQFSDFSFENMASQGIHVVKVASVDAATLDSYTRTAIEAL